jgi:hypothetical protein
MEYLERLRDQTVDAAGGAAAVAHVLALGILDARFETLLLPVWVSAPLSSAGHSILDYLAGHGAEREFFHQRLSVGGCLILADGTVEGLDRALLAYPLCRVVTAPDVLLQSGSTCP